MYLRVDSGVGFEVALSSLISPLTISWFLRKRPMGEELKIVKKFVRHYMPWGRLFRCHNDHHSSSAEHGRRIVLCKFRVEGKYEARTPVSLTEFSTDSDECGVSCLFNKD